MCTDFKSKLDCDLKGKLKAKRAKGDNTQLVIDGQRSCMIMCCLFQIVLICIVFMFLMDAFMGGTKLQHLVWDVYNELIDISSLFYCFSWSYAFDWLWRFDDEWSLGYKGVDFASRKMVVYKTRNKFGILFLLVFSFGVSCFQKTLTKRMFM